MKNEIKIGDYVYFKYSDEDSIFSRSGMIIKIHNENVSILESKHYNTVIEKVNINAIRPISNREQVVDEINRFYDEKIKELETQLKSVKRSDYQEEIKSKYLLLKEEIMNTCNNILKTTDDYEFEEKLKAICQKKKQLFSIECEGMNNARKSNGEVKYNINQLINKRENIIKNLDCSIEYLKSRIN